MAVKAVWGEGAWDDEDAAESIAGDDLARHFARKAIKLGSWVFVPDMEKEDVPPRYRKSKNLAPRSVFCGPVETDWKRGALYLENRFLTDAFDPARMSLIKAASELFSRIQQPLGRFSA